MKRSLSLFFHLQLRSFLFCCMLFPSFTAVHAQADLEGEENGPVRITGNPQPSFFGGAQLPPYRQMATFLNNAFITPDEGTVFFQDSSVCANGIPNTNDFQPFLVATYGYNDGQLDEIIFHRIDILGNRTPFSRKQFTYEGDRLRQYLYGLWDETGSQWLPARRERYLYDGNERPEAVLTEEWDGAEWMPFSRTLYQYNSQNRITGLTLAQWINDMWEDTERVLAEYNENRLPTVVTYQEKINTVWLNAARETSGYDEDFQFVQETYLLETADEMTGELENAIREQYEYDLRGFYSGRVRQLWNDTTGMWENALKDLFTYSPFGVWKRWDQEVWDGKWKPALIREFKFNNGFQVDEEQAWIPDLNEWVNTRRRLVQYDEYGNLTRERNRELWNPVTDDWVNGPEAMQCRHFWSEKTTTSVLPLERNLMECTMMNPYLPGSEINCVSGSPQGEYQVNVFDQMGRLIYQQSILDRQTFSIRGNVPMGLYYMTVSGQEKILYKRKVIIQD